MRGILFILLSSVLLLFSCKQESGEEKAKKRFADFKSDFLEEYWAQFPESATFNGYHKHDHVLSIPDEASRKESIRFAHTVLEKLATIKDEWLEASMRIDYYLIRNEMQSVIWYTDTLKPWQWQPSSYNPGSLLGYMLKGRYAPLKERLRPLMARLAKIPAYYAAARANIDRPSLPHTEMALTVTEGMIELLEKELPDSLNKAGMANGTTLDTVKAALEASKDFHEFLDSLLQEGPFRTFRLGKELYARKFHYDLQSYYTPESLWEAAQYEKDEAHTEILRLTQQLWPVYFKEKRSEFSLEESKRLIDRIASSHRPPDSFLSAIRQQLPELIAFIREKDLLTLDPEKVLEVRVAPKYLQGIAIASISAPGPYDQNEKTWYNVSPIWEMDSATAESYLREYNDYMMQILNIHEAIPGHYVQLVYANQSPDPVKSIFGSTSMIEGWACYAERMMLESGWGDHSPELWLMYYKWYLRIIGNTIIDIGVHTKAWDKDRVMNFLVNEGFQERSEAEGKWRRVQRSSVQLCSYFAGLIEILDLRDEVRSIEGEHFDLKRFNEKFLSYGSVPVKYIRKLMLEELEKSLPEDHSSDSLKR